eukprot:TRINITY_DN16345_c0_g1_i3.p1 TRINITY_DN16345_c0_g1~~TRINITY_DN16345_c0_g1_i3.p1  ORF type:complete len:322 (-),score=92.73 TRINITY_DN16345_c0_g1_i3:323-1288(-)
MFFVFKLLSCEDQSVLIGRNSFLLIEHFFHFLYCSGWLYIQMQAIESMNMEKWFGQPVNLSISQLRLLVIRLLINNVLREDIYQTKQSIFAYLELGSNVRMFDSGEIKIKLMADRESNKDATLNDISRVYIPARTKKSNDFYSIPYAGNEQSCKGREEQGKDKEKLTQADIDDIVDRLNYVKSRLAIRYREEERTVEGIFGEEKLREAARVLPRTLSELRFIVETRKWSARDEDAFVKYGNYFVQEIASYISIYVAGNSESEAIPKRGQDDSKYSIKDYEMVEEVMPKNAKERNNPRKYSKRADPKSIATISKKYIRDEFL